MLSPESGGDSAASPPESYDIDDPSLYLNRRP